MRFQTTRDTLHATYDMYGVLEIPQRYRMPKDISAADDKQIRNIQSFWTNELTYFHTAFGESAFQLGLYKRMLSDYEVMTLSRISANARYRQTKEAMMGKIKLREKHRELTTKLLQCEQDHAMYERWIMAADKIIATASREQSFREVQIRNYMGRGGQGTG